MFSIQWSNSPLGFTGQQWNYAFRSTLSIGIALWLGFELHLDAPFWAMTSAAVVSFPTAGGVLSKSLGRIVGSLVGAAMALLISTYCLSSPYLFTFYIALWLGICTYLANNYNNNVSYAFALAGYTASIIAFTAINTPHIEKMFEIMQARLSEVLLGIICSAIVSLLFPHDPDDKKLFAGILKINHQILENAKMFCQSHENNVIRQSHLKLIAQIQLLDITRIQAYWSRSHIRFKNKKLNYILHEQLRLLSLTSSIRRVFIQWQNKPQDIDQIMSTIFNELEAHDDDDYTLAKKIIDRLELNPSDIKERVLLKKLFHFCKLYTEINLLIKQLQQENNIDNHLHEESRIHIHIDHIEAARHGIRTFLIVVCGGLFSIAAQWTDAGSAMTILSVCSVLYCSALSPTNNVINLIKAFVILIVVGLIVKFFFFIQLKELWIFFLFLIPCVFILQILRAKGGKNAAIYAFIIVFFGSFTQVSNPPVYDISSFLNGGVAKILGALLAIIAFLLIPSSTAQAKNRRIFKALKSTFINQLREHSAYSQRHFESIIYSQINQLKKDDESYTKILRAGFVFLNCSYAIWLMKHWQPKNPSLFIIKQQQIKLLNNIVANNDIDPTKLDIQLIELHKISHCLASSYNEDAVHLAEITWHLYSSIQLLKGYTETTQNISAEKTPILSH